MIRLRFKEKNYKKYKTKLINILKLSNEEYIIDFVEEYLDYVKTTDEYEERLDFFHNNKN